MKTKHLFAFAWLVLASIGLTGCFDSLKVPKSDSGTEDGYSWTYDYSIRTMTFSGTGTISCPWNHRGTVKKVIISDGVTSIGESAFSSCTSLTSITIPNSVTNIGEGAFQYCSSLTSVTIPNSVTSIGDNTFYNCGLTSVTIPNSVTSIGSQAFALCRLTSVTIPNSVISIGYRAFEDHFDSFIISVTIGSNVTSIGNDAFRNCRKLKSVTCMAIEPPTMGTYGVFENVILSDISLYVPAGSIDKYMNAYIWRDFGSISAIQ